MICIPRLEEISKKIEAISPRFSVTALLLIAAAIRMGYWIKLGNPVYGGDSKTYLSWAKMLAEADLSGFQAFPLQQFYSILLTPIYIFGIPEGEYVKYFHIALSTITVGLIYLAGCLLVSRGYGLLVGILAAFYPKFLFWLPYILTETWFLFCLSLFLVIFITLLKTLNFGWFIAYLGGAFLLLVSRPVAVPVLAVSIAVLGAVILARQWNWRKVMTFCIFFGSGLLLSIYFAFAANAGLRERVLYNPTVAWSLWLSTKSKTNSMNEAVKWQKEQQKVKELFAGLPQEEEMKYKASEAISFIKENPLTYLGMAGKRFVSFWYPWIFAETWSLPHRVFDAITSFGLTTGTIFLLIDRDTRKPEIISLILMALSLAVLTSFSQIDTDARYRLPAELILLLLAPLGWLRMPRKVVSYSSFKHDCR